MRQYLLLMFVWLLGLAGTAYGQTPAAHYAFTGHAKDGSGFANHAAVNGANLTQDRFGIANHAFFFDGEQSGLTAPNAAHLNSANATISFWINPASFPAQGEAYLLSFGGWQQRWKISLPGHGKPVFTTHSNGACCSDMDSNSPLPANVWTHVTMVHNGTQNIIYFNGVEVNQKSVNGALDPTTHP
ncbi:MAG TPA: LamG domain-containing protein, partial [Saprospiraceae bacterium]|nr:LamG domain-containing protein [Saprospiraceae bacterium]